MKCCSLPLSASFLILLILTPIASARHIRPRSNHYANHRSSTSDKVVEAKLYDFMRQMAGSRLPDCSHACGSCSPCKLVMISFVCASLEEAESCPISYRCMCHGKSYPVP